MTYSLKVARNDGVYSTSQQPAGTAVRNEVSNGCRWDVEDVYGPTTSWGGCDDADGSQQIVEQDGQLWPLEVGARKSWRLVGINADGAEWRVWQRCEVTSAHVVTIGDEDIETFRVRCDDADAMRVYYHSPRHGHQVYYQSVRTGKLGDSATRWEGDARVLEGGSMSVDFLPARAFQDSRR